jgi:hypothetical protein
MEKGRFPGFLVRIPPSYRKPRREAKPPDSGPTPGVGPTRGGHKAVSGGGRALGPRRSLRLPARFRFLFQKGREVQCAARGRGLAERKWSVPRPRAAGCGRDPFLIGVRSRK